MNKYLLEIGVEELPYKFITSAEKQLNEIFERFLNENEIKYSNIEIYTTPRRLSIIINDSRFTT